MNSPVIFTFNLRRSVYEMFGISHFGQIRKKYPGVYFLPVVNNLDEGIEQRAQKISTQLPILLKNLYADQAHIISYSVSGLDARYALSSLKMAKYAKSLTTIATPHKGSKAANLSERNFLRKLQIDPITRLIGIGIKPFHELVPENIHYFNQEIKDAPKVKYFSMGAQKQPNNCHASLREVGNHLRNNTEKNYTYENDGVFGHDEIQWGQHLANFDADHSEVVGLTSDLEKVRSIELALENIEGLESEGSSQKLSFSS